MYSIFIKYRIIDSLRTGDVFAMVAPLPSKNGEKRRPEIRQLFAGSDNWRLWAPDN